MDISPAMRNQPNAQDIRLLQTIDSGAQRLTKMLRPMGADSVDALRNRCTHLTKLGLVSSKLTRERRDGNGWAKFGVSATVRVYSLTEAGKAAIAPVGEECEVRAV